MIKIRGVLALAFDSVICMRGFADISDLAQVSCADDEYQRDLTDQHADEIKRFLRGGRFSFFPEIILGTSVEDLGGEDDVFEKIKLAAKDGVGFSHTEVGNLGVSISTYVKNGRKAKRYADELDEEAQIRGEDDYVSMTITNLPMQNDKRCLYRLDGNHRLTAVEQMLKEGDARVKDFRSVPFCIVIFNKRVARKQHGAVYFHNINFKQLKVPEEHLLRLVVEDKGGLWADDVLKDDPSLGPEYYLTRRFVENKKSLFYRLSLAFPKMNDTAYGMVFHCFKFLMSCSCDLVYESDTIVADGKIKVKGERTKRPIIMWPSDVNQIIAEFSDNLEDVIKAACLQSESVMNLDRDIFIAMMYYRYLDKSQLANFAQWVAANRITFSQVAIEYESLISMYEAYKISQEKTVFVSMEFGKDETENHFKVIKRVVDELNREHCISPGLEVKRVDRVVDGTAYEINHKISDEIEKCGLLIADLTYVNPNVYHEIGLVMGRDIAEGRHAGANLIMILDESVSEEKKIVKFNLHSYKQLRFKQSEDLATKLKEEIKEHFKHSLWWQDITGITK